MSKPDKIVHDRALFDAVIARLAPSEPDMRAGAMFGSPAIFVGRRMAFCVFGRALGVKLPEARTKALIAAGAVAFRPYGKVPMREWIAIEPEKGGIEAALPLLAEAIAYARSA